MLSIDVCCEQVVLLADLGKCLGRRVPRSTVREWIRRGRKNPFTKRRVYLESIQMPAGKSTSVEAYQRFIEALNEEP